MVQCGFFCVWLLSFIIVPNSLPTCYMEATLHCLLLLFLWMDLTSSPLCFHPFMIESLTPLRLDWRQYCILGIALPLTIVGSLPFTECQTRKPSLHWGILPEQVPLIIPRQPNSNLMAKQVCLTPKPILCYATRKEKHVFRLTTFAVLLALVVGLKWKVKITVIVGLGNSGVLFSTFWI